VEHSAGASFAANPLYFDPKNIVELAIEAGCNCVASTYGVLASVSRRYAHRIPFLVKLNHNETLSYPTEYDQTSTPALSRRSIWGRWPWERRSISAQNNRVVR
jgi:class I fructose-bisphosphate aldolase